MATDLTVESFDELIGSSGAPAVVDFWAEWCGPCKQVAPILDAIAEELTGQMTLAKVDVDAQAQLAARFSVMSIPTMIVFKEGAEVGRLVAN